MAKARDDRLVAVTRTSKLLLERAGIAVVLYRRNLLMVAVVVAVVMAVDVVVGNDKAPASPSEPEMRSRPGEYRAEHARKRLHAALRITLNPPRARDEKAWVELAVSCV